MYNCMFTLKSQLKVKTVVSIGPYQLFQRNTQDVLCEYSHEKSETLVEIRPTITEIDFFLGDCFLMAHPVDVTAQKTSECGCNNFTKCKTSNLSDYQKCESQCKKFSAVYSTLKYNARHKKHN